MGKHVFFQVGEVAFDAIDPGRVGGDELQMDIMLGCPSQNRGGLVGAEVIHHDPNRPVVLAAHGLEEAEKFARSFASLEVSPELAGGDIESGDEMTHPVQAPIGGALTFGPGARLPGTARMGTQFHGSEFVDADHGFLARLGMLIEALGGVFFTLKSGSVDCFQVLVRWSET